MGSGVNWDKKTYFGHEYVKDEATVSMCFELQFYSPAELQPFEFFYKNRKITGVQRGRYLTVSFIEKLPRTLVDDIVWGRKNSEQYVYGCLTTPLGRVNQEILRQRYALGHFLASTFSFFDIASITLTNVDEKPTDEIIKIPWPPIFSAPPHAHFSESIGSESQKVFIRDYIDAWNDFFRGDYDNCVRHLITSVENAFSFFKLDEKRKYPWWRPVARLRSSKPTFKQVIKELKRKSKSLSHNVVADNLLFLYRVRNNITHGSLRIHQENGWWFCGKGLETVQYLYQFLNNGAEGAYAFRTYAFANQLFHEIRGTTLEQAKARGKFMFDESRSKKNSVIDSDEKMNEWKFGNLLINKGEQSWILNGRPRE